MAEAPNSNKKMTIGITRAEHGRLTQTAMQAIGEVCHVSHLSEAALDALRCGDVQALAADLHLMPVEAPEGVVITAVSARTNPAVALLIRSEVFATGELFRLKRNALLGCFSAIQQAQFQENRPDVSIQIIHSGTALEQLTHGQVDALLLPEADLPTDPTGFEKLVLSPLEFVPAPAQGVVAWQCLAADIPTRQLLQRIHHSEVSACTNVERKVLRLLGDEYSGHLGVYCERDGNGFYHAVAAALVQGELRTARMSSSTNFGLAENLVRQLNA